MSFNYKEIRSKSITPINNSPRLKSFTNFQNSIIIKNNLKQEKQAQKIFQT